MRECGAGSESISESPREWSQRTSGSASSRASSVRACKANKALHPPPPPLGRGGPSGRAPRPPPTSASPRRRPPPTRTPSRSRSWAHGSSSRSSSWARGSSSRPATAAPRRARRPTSPCGSSRPSHSAASSTGASSPTGPRRSPCSARSPPTPPPPPRGRRPATSPRRSSSSSRGSATRSRRTPATRRPSSAALPSSSSSSSRAAAVRSRISPASRVRYSLGAPAEERPIAGRPSFSKPQQPQFQRGPAAARPPAPAADATYVKPTTAGKDEQSKALALPTDRAPKLTPALMSYIMNFKFPYVEDVGIYEQTMKIGQGTFGEVFKARCKRTNSYVALKKILMENEKEGFPITALREIKMLQKIPRHPNITELLQICSGKQSTGRDRFCFYLVFTFCEHDLAGLLSHNKAQLKLVHIKTMMRHILNGLYSIHSQNILHRDMKAANILITHDGVLKLADFGLARLMLRYKDACYTNRVVTLWYRPPELLLGTRNYGPSIDIWGAGCIMAELWTRSPILQGETEQQQLKLISNLCGSINADTWANVGQLPYYGKMELPAKLPRRLRERLRGYVGANEMALSLMDQMLTLSPEQRPTAENALDHHFFFENPRPQENIRDLIDTLPKNLFEYVSGCGAHAHRNRAQLQQAPGQRPVHPHYQQQQQQRAQMGRPNPAAQQHQHQQRPMGPQRPMGGGGQPR